jgi:hypothetical protein
MCELMKMKLKMQWRSDKVREAGNMECLLRKAEGSEQRYPRRETTWPKSSKAMGTGLPETFAATSCFHVPWMLDVDL